ncbi:hypothetical protein D3C85_1745910 [compost metagenome]
MRLSGAEGVFHFFFVLIDQCVQVLDIGKGSHEAALCVFCLISSLFIEALNNGRNGCTCNQTNTGDNGGKQSVVHCVNPLRR